MKIFVVKKVLRKTKKERNMQINETREKMNRLRLSGMVRSLDDQLEDSESSSMSFEDRLSLLVDREYTDRENKKLASRLRNAKLKQQAVLEDFDYSTSRGLLKTTILSLADCNWVSRSQNMIITGATGTGKTFLASAFAQKACRVGFQVAYYRVSRLFEELVLARAEGNFLKFLERLQKKDLLVLDDWGMQVLTEQQSKDFMEVIEDRYDCRSTVLASQVPVKNWHELIVNANSADAILDRIVHNSHRIELKGGSIRKKLKSVNEDVIEISDSKS